MNRKFKLILKIGFTLLLLSLFLSKVNISQSVFLIKTIPWQIIILITIIYILSLALSALKWKTFLPTYSFLNLLTIGMLGRFYSFVMPGQMTGEIAKAYHFGKGKKDAIQIAASIFLDKVTGISAILFIGMTGFLFSKKSISYLALVSLCALIGIVILFLLLLKCGKITKILNFFVNDDDEKRKSKHRQLIDKFKQLIQEMEKYMQNILLICQNTMFGIAYQFMSVLIIYLFSQSLKINVDLIDYCWITAFISLALFIPLTIGGLGVREGSFLGILKVFGVSSEKALMLSFLFFTIQLLDAALGGLIFLYNNMRQKYGI